MGPVQEELHEKIAKKNRKKKLEKKCAKYDSRFDPTIQSKPSAKKFAFSSLSSPLPLFKFLTPLFGYPNRTNPNRPDYPYRKTCSAESELLRRRLTVWNVFLHQRFSKTTLSLSTVILFFSIP
jgi:hypothetical protein